MDFIEYNGEKYFLAIWRVQCLKCDSVVQTWNGRCRCGLVIVKEGRKTWPYFPTEDVSIWKSRTGKILPQHVLDHHYLSRKAYKTSTNTETSTSTSRSSN